MVDTSSQSFLLVLRCRVGAGAWGCLVSLGGDAGSWPGSEVSVHYGRRVTIGLEDLPQVSEFLPPCAATANLSSVPQTLDDASFDPGWVVGVKIEVSVRMCLLAKD